MHARRTASSLAERPSPPAVEGARPLRADAARNRQRVLDAAEVVFAREGLAVPIDAVAREAGVGVGTLYRHFPTKEALFEAIVVAKVEQLIDECAALESRPPAEAFFAFLLRVAEEASDKHDLIDAMSSSAVEFSAESTATMEALKERVDGLRRRAVEAGGLRDDVDAEQILHLVFAACRSDEVHGLSSDGHMLRVVFDGLRYRG